MSDPEPQPEPTEAEIFELRTPAQLAFFDGMVIAHRKVVLPTPKAIPAKLDDGTDLDPADGDILTVAYDVKVYQTTTGTKFKLIKQGKGDLPGGARYTRSKRQELTYSTQYVEGTARIVEHSRPEGE